MQTSRRTLAADYLTDALCDFITSRNSGIDLALILVIGFSGVLGGIVSPLFILATVVAGVAYVVRGHAHDKAERNAEEARLIRERQVRYIIQH